jgi:hypothetical protein
MKSFMQSGLCTRCVVYTKPVQMLVLNQMGEKLREDIFQYVYTDHETYVLKQTMLKSQNRCKEIIWETSRLDRIKVSKVLLSLGSAAARLPRLRVRIPPGAWMLSVVSVVCLSGLCDGLIFRPEESYRLCCVIVCDLETSRLRRLKPASGL